MFVARSYTGARSESSAAGWAAVHPLAGQEEPLVPEALEGRARASLKARLLAWPVLWPTGAALLCSKHGRSNLFSEGQASSLAGVVGRSNVLLGSKYGRTASPLF